MLTQTVISPSLFQNAVPFVRLDVALVGHRGLELALEDDVGVGEALFHVAELEAQMARRVRGALGAVGAGHEARGHLRGAHVLVQLRRALGHRLVDAHHRVERLVDDVDQRERVLGDVRVGRADGGDGMPGVERLVRGEHVVAHVLERRERLAEVDEVVAEPREVRVGHDGEHALEGERLRGIDADDAGVGVGAAQHAAEEHAGQAHVGAVLGPAGDLVRAVRAYGTGADDLVSLGRDHAVLLHIARRLRRADCLLPRMIPRRAPARRLAHAGRLEPFGGLKRIFEGSVQAVPAVPTLHEDKAGRG